MLRYDNKRDFGLHHLKSLGDTIYAVQISPRPTRYEYATWMATGTAQMLRRGAIQWRIEVSHILRV